VCVFFFVSVFNFASFVGLSIVIICVCLFSAKKNKNKSDFVKRGIKPLNLQRACILSIKFILDLCRFVFC
jgi:hypothetical protein